MGNNTRVCIFISYTKRAIFNIRNNTDYADNVAVKRNLPSPNESYRNKSADNKKDNKHIPNKISISYITK